MLYQIVYKIVLDEDKYRQLLYQIVYKIVFDEYKYRQLAILTACLVVAEKTGKQKTDLYKKWSSIPQSTINKAEELASVW